MPQKKYDDNDTDSSDDHLRDNDLPKHAIPIGLLILVIVFVLVALAVALLIVYPINKAYQSEGFRPLLPVIASLAD